MSTSQNILAGIRPEPPLSAACTAMVAPMPKGKSMNDLIKVESRPLSGDAIKTCNARDLHAFLEVGKDFSTWINGRIDQYGFVEGEDFSPVLGKSSGGRPSVEYHITLDMAKELSMVERNAKGKQARQYFIDCERRARTIAPGLTPANMSRRQLLRMALDMEDELLALEERVVELEPKAAFHDAVCESVSLHTFEEAAKVLGIGRNRLFELLRNEGVLIKGSRLPYQSQIEAGRFRVIECAFEDSRGISRTDQKPHITGKGLVWLQNRFFSNKMGAEK